MALFELIINGKGTGIPVERAESFTSRLAGLMGKARIDKGLMITDCGSIHTFFMKSDIDAVFIGSSGAVVKIIAGLKPWRLVFPVSRAKETLELAPGQASGLGLKYADIITLSPAGR